MSNADQLVTNLARLRTICSRKIDVILSRKLSTTINSFQDTGRASSGQGEFAQNNATMRNNENSYQQNRSFVKDVFRMLGFR